MKFNLEYWNGLTKDEQTAIKRRFPSVFWVPNHAQKRPFSRWRTRPYPRTHIITFGNRTGKTEFLGEFLTGVVRGSKYVNPEHCYSQFFDDMDEKRKAGTLTVWWICEADLMKKGAADYKIIAKHMPDAMFKNRTNVGVFREIHVPVMGENNKEILIVVHVKTHDQETIAFAGDNVDVIICDEPPPQKHWGEIAARIISLAGEQGGRIIIGGTPLKMSAFLLDIIEESKVEKEEERVVHDEGSIWENCDGKEIPPDKAKKYGIPYNEELGCYETNGHLSRDGIENAIKNWKKSDDPDEVMAREDGKFTHVQGRIYKIFNRDVHSINPFSIPKNFPIIMICDPHDTRPDVVGWYVTTPRNKLICIAEYPTLPYENLVSRPETIPQTCEIWRRIEADLGISTQIAGRYGDPNMMLDPDPYTKKTKQELYRMHGFNFSVNVSDNVQYGHERVRQMLWYDQQRFEQFPDDPMYQSSLLFFNTCRNHINFMVKYTTKTQKDMSKAISETVDGKWKDFADLVRYACVVFKPFETIQETWLSPENEWKKIKAARDPFDNFGESGEKYTYHTIKN